MVDGGRAGSDHHDTCRGVQHKGRKRDHHRTEHDVLIDVKKADQLPQRLLESFHANILSQFRINAAADLF